MKLGKTARAAWANIFRAVLLAFTLELPWPHSLHWLRSAVDWGSAVMVIGSMGMLGVWALFNAWWLVNWALTADPPYQPERPSVTGDRVPAGVSRHGAMVTVRASALRYLGPPPVYVPARGVVRPPAPAVVHRDATWVFPAARAGCLLRAAPPCPDDPCYCRDQGYLP